MLKTCPLAQSTFAPSHKGAFFRRDPKHEQEFVDLKDALTSPDTMLYHPDWNEPFVIHTDASKHGCGAMFAQWYQGKLRPVKFASRSFNATESRWPTTHQELFAVKWSLDQHCPYVLGRRIKIIKKPRQFKVVNIHKSKTVKVSSLVHFYG